MNKIKQLILITFCALPVLLLFAGLIFDDGESLWLLNGVIWTVVLIAGIIVVAVVP